MKRAKILVTVKTYPLISSKYTETVCTAGIKEDGSWIRLYPIPYRSLDKTQKFHKYQWIEAEITRNTIDPRPESYRLVGDITPLEYVDTQNGWEKRKSLLGKHIYTNLGSLIDEARNPIISTSLAVFKPSKITGFYMREAVLRQKKRQHAARQFDVLEPKMPVEDVPYTFHYSFVDDEGRYSCQQILDWEIYQLCRKLMRKYG